MPPSRIRPDADVAGTRMHFHVRRAHTQNAYAVCAPQAAPVRRRRRGRRRAPQRSRRRGCPQWTAPRARTAPSLPWTRRAAATACSCASRTRSARALRSGGACRRSLRHAYQRALKCAHACGDMRNRFGIRVPACGHMRNRACGAGRAPQVPRRPSRARAVEAVRGRRRVAAPARRRRERRCRRGRRLRGRARGCDGAARARARRGGVRARGREPALALPALRGVPRRPRGRATVPRGRRRAASAARFSHAAARGRRARPPSRNWRAVRCGGRARAALRVRGRLLAARAPPAGTRVAGAAVARGGAGGGGGAGARCLGRRAPAGRGRLVRACAMHIFIARMRARAMRVCISRMRARARRLCARTRAVALARDRVRVPVHLPNYDRCARRFSLHTSRALTASLRRFVGARDASSAAGARAAAADLRPVLVPGDTVRIRIRVLAGRVRKCVREWWRRCGCGAMGRWSTGCSRAPCPPRSPSPRACCAAPDLHSRIVGRVRKCIRELGARRYVLGALLDEAGAPPLDAASCAAFAAAALEFTLTPAAAPPLRTTVLRLLARLLDGVAGGGRELAGALRPRLAPLFGELLCLRESEARAWRAGRPHSGLLQVRPRMAMRIRGCGRMAICSRACGHGDMHSRLRAW